MPKTTNLNLELTTADTTTFKSYREAMSGEGGVGSESNMQLIDAWAGEVDGLLDGVETLLAAL
jgi:hypothetical protein